MFFKRSGFYSFCVLLPYINIYYTFPAKFHPIEVLSRYRDPQLQVAEN